MAAWSGAGAARGSVIAAEGGHHVEERSSVFSSALLCLLFVSTASLRAQETPPAGFHRRVLADRPVWPVQTAPRRHRPRHRSGGGLPPPRPVVVLDGREGRPDNAPKLTPEYLAKWEVIRKSRMAGSDEFDPNARCLSAGMPNMMSMTYGMEIQHTKDKITMYGELNDVYRRIFLDGRTAVAESARRSDVRRLFHRALGRGHARRGHRGYSRGRAVRHVLAAQRSVHRARAHPIHVAWRPRGSDHGRRIQKRCSNPSPRFVRIGRRPRRTTSCASSRARRDWRRRSSPGGRHSPECHRVRIFLFASR